LGNLLCAWWIKRLAHQHTTSPVPGVEEYAIHDFEGFDGYPLGEYEGIESAHAIAEFIEAFPAFGAALLTHCGDVDEARTAAEDNYCGCYISVADFAQELIEETTEIPPNLVNYIDYAAIARDMTLSGDVFVIETRFDEVHIFWNR
jgi:antirestriction protein